MKGSFLFVRTTAFFGFMFLQLVGSSVSAEERPSWVALGSPATAEAQTVACKKWLQKEEVSSEEVTSEALAQCLSSLQSQQEEQLSDAMEDAFGSSN